MATAMPFWLMPVVPPMVSATTGAAVSTHMPEGAPRIAVLVFCYILFALALTAAIGILVAVARQFARNRSAGVDVIPFNAIPSLWIPLGVIGQSIAASNLLAAASRHALSPEHADTPARIRDRLRNRRRNHRRDRVCHRHPSSPSTHCARGLDFSLGWWSFTFPIGACAVGANAFGVATGSTLILGIATCPADRTDPHLGNRRGQGPSGRSAVEFYRRLHEFAPMSFGSPYGLYSRRPLSRAGVHGESVIASAEFRRFE